MSGILPDLIEALRMSLTLPWYVALPVYAVAYSVGALAVILVVNAAARAYRLWRDVLKK